MSVKGGSRDMSAKGGSREKSAKGGRTQTVSYRNFSDDEIKANLLCRILLENKKDWVLLISEGRSSW